MNSKHTDDLYEIRIAERLGSNTLIFFDNFTAEYSGNGETVLRGPVTDQAALHGLLAQICSLGLTLTFFRKMGNGQTTGDVQRHEREESDVS